MCILNWRLAHALTVSTTMTEQAEQYRIVLHREIRGTSLATSTNRTTFLQAFQGESAVGDFTLDFIAHDDRVSATRAGRDGVAHGVGVLRDALHDRQS
jgi:hypothetical protein